MREQQNYLIYTELTYSLSNFAFSCLQALYRNKDARKKETWEKPKTIFLSKLLSYIWLHFQSRYM